MTLLMAALIACVGCSMPADTVSSPHSPDRIEFLRKVDRLLVGQQIQLLARAVAADGSPLADRIAWRTSSSSYVSLAADGRITGITPGRLTIMAVAGDRLASFELEVLPDVVESLSLSPDYEVTRVGEEVRFEFRALDRDRALIQGIQPSWELPSGLDASMTDEGVFVARAPGLHTIVAVVGDRKAIATVRVAPR